MIISPPSIKKLTSHDEQHTNVVGQQQQTNKQTKQQTVTKDISE